MSSSRRRDEPAKRRGGGFNLFSLLGSLARPRAVARVESRPYAQPMERRRAAARDPAWPDPDDRADTIAREPDTWDNGDDRQDYVAGPVHYGGDAEPRWEDTREHYLAVHNVEKSFGGRKVVKGVSLYLRRGEAVGLLGPNGAGKTTVFYMITGLVKADRGSIELDGHDITGLPMYQHGRLGIGYLPQEASIFRGLNVEQNIRAVLEQVEPDRKKREAELDALLDEFNITRLRKTPSLAAGER